MVFNSDVGPYQSALVALPRRLLRRDVLISNLQKFTIQKCKCNFMAAIEEETAIPLLLRPFSPAAAAGGRTSQNFAVIGALLYDAF